MKHENGILLTRLGFDDIVAPTGADGPAAGEHLELFSMSVAGGTEKTIRSLGPTKCVANDLKK